MTNIDIARIAGARAGNLIKRAALSADKGHSPIQEAERRALTEAGSPNLIQGSMDPSLKAGLIGSLIGAGVGGIGNAAFGNKKRSLLARLGIGAGIGGAAGGLGGVGIAAASGASPRDYLESLMRGPKPAPLRSDEGGRLNEQDAIETLPIDQRKYAAHGLYTNRQTNPNKVAMDASRTPSPSMEGPTDHELGRLPGLVNSNMGGGRGISDRISDLYQKSNFDNPMGTNAAIGAGIGGVAGGLGNALFGNRKRSLLARLGLGALGGAAAGGGIGAGAGYLNSSSNAGQKGSPGFDPNDDQNMGTAHNYLNQYEEAMAPFRALKAKMDANRQSGTTSGEDRELMRMQQLSNRG